MPTEDFDPRRVLVVDDEGRMLRTHGRVLAADGLHPVLMADPGEALEEAKRCCPAAVVIDLVMPGMSGLAFVGRLRSHYALDSPPVMCVSGNLEQLSAGEMVMFDVLQPKPYCVDRFCLTVRKLCRQHLERRLAASRGRVRDGFELDVRVVEED